MQALFDPELWPPAHQLATLQAAIEPLLTTAEPLTNLIEVTAGHDLHGNPMSGSADTIALYDRAIDRLVRFHPDIIELSGRLSGDDAPGADGSGARGLPQPDEHRSRRSRAGPNCVGDALADRR